MKLLVLSDSHGMLRGMEAAVMQERPDVILHLGDRERDAWQLEERFPEVPLLQVPGNCDFPAPGRPLTLLREFGGVRIFMTHGHRYDVKQGLLSLELAAREAAADVAVFGHTHSAFCEKHDGLWLLNPGASGMGTCGVIWIEGGRAVCSTVKIR